MNLFQAEPEIWEDNPRIMAAKIFPPNFHFKPTSPNKTQEFYEFILVDTGSIGIKHYSEKDDELEYSYSTFQILKVLTPSDWGQDFNRYKRFSQNCDPIGFNYWDYMEVWYNTFWYQNKRFGHSWLMYFKIGVQYYFPQWFNRWWDFFGPCQEICQPVVKEGLEYFSKHFNLNGDPFPTDLHLFLKFS